MVRYIVRFLFLITGSCLQAQIVEIQGGQIRGEKTEFYIAFEGLRYGDRFIVKRDRFEPPKPFTTKWKGVRDASAPGNICIQWDMFYGTEDDRLHGDEDCLFLNVYTPDIDGTEKFEVIVYIHGGGFMFGSGSDNRPDRLLKYKKLVLVTLNYRLGPLGFLCTEDDEIPCNLGLKDQNMALKWVRDNIHAFNGDPNKVIITGYSAGGASVHLHMLSPQSRNLFGAAVSHSGTAFCSWASVEDSLEKANRLGVYLGCSTENTTLLKSCLKSKDAADIVRAVKKFQRFMYNPFTVFAPTIEKYGSKDPFISEKLENIILRGRSAKVPWVVAFTQEEGGFNAATLMQKNPDGNEIINTFGEIWPLIAGDMMFYNETVNPRLHNLKAKNLKRQYLGRQEFSVATYRNTQKMFSDMLFFRGIDKAIRLHSKTPWPVYAYRYNKTFTGGIARLMSHDADFDFGSIHGDDVYHIFETVYIDSTKFTKKDDQISLDFAQLYGSLLQINKTPIYGNKKLPRTYKSGTKIRLLQINDSDDYEVIEVRKLFN